jgi:hypothetical protein
MENLVYYLGQSNAEILTSTPDVDYEEAKEMVIDFWESGAEEQLKTAWRQLKQEPTEPVTKYTTRVLQVAHKLQDRWPHPPGLSEETIPRS